jgi:hypothetical protein
MKILFILSFLILTPLSINAQDQDCNCCTDNHDQFDFWLGEWNVFDKNGKKVGENTIVELQDNCLIQENWVSESMTGSSYNYFNPADSSWNQVWIDNVGSSLILKGSYMDGKMILKSELLKGKKIDFYYNQITWEKSDDGSVIQIWDTFDKEDQLITNIFTGIYRKK